jgi:hypothetical protein
MIGDIMTTLTEKYDESIAQELLREQGILKQILLDWLKVLELRIKIYREREELKVLSAMQLKDIGITRAEANFEAMRSDIPAGRLITLERS